MEFEEFESMYNEIAGPLKDNILCRELVIRNSNDLLDVWEERRDDPAKLMEYIHHTKRLLDIFSMDRADVISYIIAGIDKHKITYFDIEYATMRLFQPITSMAFKQTFEYTPEIKTLTTIGAPALGLIKYHALELFKDYEEIVQTAIDALEQIGIHRYISREIASYITISERKYID